jgi:hypothetical protein
MGLLSATVGHVLGLLCASGRASVERCSRTCQMLWQLQFEPEATSNQFQNPEPEQPEIDLAWRLSLAVKRLRNILFCRVALAVPMQNGYDHVQGSNLMRMYM